MSNSQNKVNEIDLYSILEDIWKNRAIVIISIVVSCLLAGLYSLPEKPQHTYLTISETHPPSLTDLSKLDIYGDDAIKVRNNHLKNLESQLEDFDFLYEAFNSNMKANGPAHDWLSPEKTIQVNSNEVVFEYLRERLLIKRENEKLILELITDIPNTGITLLEFILAKAQEDILSEAIKTVKMESAIRYNSSLSWLVINNYVSELLERTPSDAMEKFTSEELVSIANTALDFQIKFGAQKRPHTESSMLPKRLTRSFPSISSSSQTTVIMSTKKNPSKILISSAFFGLLIGVIIALLIEGFKRRKYQLEEA